MAVESSADDNGQTEEPEVTILLRHSGALTRKARWRSQGVNTALVWQFFDKREVHDVLLAFSKERGCSKTVNGNKYAGSTAWPSFTLGTTSLTASTYRAELRHVRVRKTTYVAKGVLLAAVTDPRIKTLDLPSDEDNDAPRQL